MQGCEAGVVRHSAASVTSPSVEEWLDIHREAGGAGIDVGFPCEVLEIRADRVGDAFWCHQHAGMKIHRYRHYALIGLKVFSVSVLHRNATRRSDHAAQTLR